MECLGVYRWEHQRNRGLALGQWRCSCGEGIRVEDDDRIVCRVSGRTVGRIARTLPECELVDGCSDGFNGYVLHALTGLEVPACSFHAAAGAP